MGDSHYRQQRSDCNTESGQETFKLNEGDRLVVLGDDAEGIALVKVDVFEQRVQEALKLSRQMTNE